MNKLLKSAKKQHLHIEKAILGLTGRWIFDYLIYNGTFEKELWVEECAKGIV